MWVALPDSRRVEAAFVNEGAVFDEVCEDGAHRAFIARGLEYIVGKGDIWLGYIITHLSLLQNNEIYCKLLNNMYSRVSLVSNSPWAMLEARSSCRPNELRWHSRQQMMLCLSFKCSK